jgi:hypothetical protein
MMPKRWWFVYIQRAYGRLVSFCTDGRFYSHSNWIAVLAVTFANYSAIPALDDVIFTVGNNFTFTNSKLLAVLVLFC